MIPCKYPENKGLFLKPCPRCNSADIEESGDDFDGQVSCNTCELSTYSCYGTKNAIHVWNSKLNMEKWETDIIEGNLGDMPSSRMILNDYSHCIPFENYKPPTWDELFMGKVYEIASKSKDPHTKIGAVFVKNRHSPLEGFNGICKGVDDFPERMERPEKYFWMEHAERNVINMAAKLGISTEGGILYTQGLPCVDCARGVINSGIIEIVLHKQWEDISTKIITGRPWTEHHYRSKIMFDEAEIKIRYLDAILGKKGYLDGKVFNV